MLTRKELLLRKAWAFNAYKEGRIPERRYKELVEDFDLQLKNKTENDKEIMKKMFNQIRKEYSHS